MVRVPEYQPSVELRPALRQDLAPNATPQAFGSDVGTGMESLSKGGMRAARSIAAVRELDDTMLAKDADNKYSGWLRERMYGEGGFMTLEGRNAVDGRSAFEKEAEEKRLEFGKGLTPGAAQHYQKASDARLASTLQQSITHTAQARKTWFNETSKARVESFADDALVNFDKPAMVTKNIRAGLMEIREVAGMHGWDGDVLRDRERDFVSGVHKNIALKLAQSDPLAAEKYINDKSDFLSGSDRFALDSALKVPMREAHAQRAAANFFARPMGDATASDMIKRFEGFESSAKWDVNHFRTGYGSDTITRDDGSVVEVRQGMSVTRADAERDLQRRIGQTQSKIIATVGGDRWGAMSAPARAAVTSVAYNYGSLPNSVVNAVRTGGPAEIATAIRGLEGANDGVNRKRRNQEADAVLGLDIGTAGRNAQSYFTGMEEYLSGIKDPDVRELTRRRINASLETQNKAEQAATKQAKAQLWSYVDRGMTPDQVPMEVRRQAAGMDAVSSAWNYFSTASKGRDVKDDEQLVYSMRRVAASNPDDFAKVDLNDYRDKLSKGTIKELTGLQTGALTDQRKAREEGLHLTEAYSQATEQLRAVGITTEGKKGSQLEAAHQRIARFNNALTSQMDEFKRGNNGRAPTQMDIQSMINRLLLPVVIKTPGTFWDSKTEGFAFDAARRPDNSTVTQATKYEDVPIDLRRGIAVDLERELGRKPSEAEVLHRYADYVLNRTPTPIPPPQRGSADRIAGAIFNGVAEVVLGYPARAVGGAIDYFHSGDHKDADIH